LDAIDNFLKNGYQIDTHLQKWVSSEWFYLSKSLILHVIFLFTTITFTFCIKKVGGGVKGWLHMYWLMIYYLICIIKFFW